MAGKKLLVVRGDLRSQNGYSRALRAHLKLLAPHFDRVVGVDIHYHKAISNQAFDWEIFNERGADKLIAEGQFDSCVLNYTTPEKFRRLPGALNIGYFYWETDRYNPQLNWRSYIQLMDEMWLPVEFMRPAVLECGFKGNIFILPWPQEGRPSEASQDNSISVFPINALDRRSVLDWMIKAVMVQHVTPTIGKGALNIVRGKWQDRVIGEMREPLDEVLAKYKTVYLSVMQNVPRKGLLLLFSEWLHYVQRNSTASSCLLLKLSPVEATQKYFEVFLGIYDRVKAMARSLSISNPRLVLCVDRLTESQMNYLYSRCDVLVSTSMGEGFGGPVVEAALRMKSVITARHTSFESFIPEEYPLLMKADYAPVSLKGQIYCYSPSSRWSVIQGGELERRMADFESMSPQARTAIAQDLCQAIEKYCGWNRVEDRLKSKMESMSAAAH